MRTRGGGHVRDELGRRWQRWAERNLERGPDSGTGGPDVTGLRAHLDACASCRAEHEAWARLFRVLAADPGVRAPEGLVEAVLARVPATAPAAARRRRLSPWEGLLWALGACGAITATVVAVGVAVSPGAALHALAAVAGRAALGLGLVADVAAALAAAWKGYQLALLTYSAPAAAGTLATVAAVLLLARREGPAQTSAR